MHFCCRAPHGARGLKWSAKRLLSMFHVSRPAWGAWIEISTMLFLSRVPRRRAPHGARGLKSHSACTLRGYRPRRAPHGARGLKSIGIGLMAFGATSRPAWGAWIEIRWRTGTCRPRLRRRAPHGARGLKSPAFTASTAGSSVAPRMGRVD